jgi:hypothetical protein
LKKNISNDQWVKNLDFGNTYQNFDQYLISVLDQYRTYRNHPENPLLAEFNWFYFLPAFKCFPEKDIGKTSFR